MNSSEQSYDVMVIGGGINGLSTCYHLARMDVGRIGLLEQFELGHERGSSHGHSRITRSAYVNAHYAGLMKILHQQEWPRLERDANRILIHFTPGCFFGPPGSTFEKYANSALEVGADVEVLEPVEARKRFPQFRFENAAGVLHDRTAGLLAASDIISSLISLAYQNQVEIHDQTTVKFIDPMASPVIVETENVTFRTDKLIVTAGAWVRNLLPALSPRVTVARQTVGYFKLAGPAEDFSVGRFPVWGYHLVGEDMVYYGLPEFGRDGIKLARHITGGVDDNPDDLSQLHPSEAIEDLRNFVTQQFTAPIECFVEAETCLYTNTETEDFILDTHPDNPNIVIGSGFSGHGFKFGPLTGRVLSELAFYGKTAIPEFEAARHLFTL